MKLVLNNAYNFRNPVRHFINVDGLEYPNDISGFNPISELSWTRPVYFRIYKTENSFRVIKFPNILNFARAYEYYKVLNGFFDVKLLDAAHKRLEANLDTGDFVAGNYDSQLDEDLINLCNYDVLLKLDISEYYGRIYTHYLDLELYKLEDNPLAWLNNGRTSGILMGNYLSLYFAEYMSSKISEKLVDGFKKASVECKFNYFSDDFYFFCNNKDIEMVTTIFDMVLSEFDFIRKNKSEIWRYESYNAYNLLTRHWKSTIRRWNLDKIKDDKKNKKNPGSCVKHRYSFLNQIVYRLSLLSDEKSRRSFIVNFFKTNHFQMENFEGYKIEPYDLHQLLFLIKSAPESLLYVAHIIEKIDEIKTDDKTKEFLRARYREALKNKLHDVQLYFYYALELLGFDEVLHEMQDIVVETQNQVLISYYLKDGFFDQNQIDKLKKMDGEEYWFQSYHLIMFRQELVSDLQTSITKYLIPERVKQMQKGKAVKEKRYMDFYLDNLNKKNQMIENIQEIKNKVCKYLKLRDEETKKQSRQGNIKQA